MRKEMPNRNEREKSRDTSKINIHSGVIQQVQNYVKNWKTGERLAGSVS